MRGVEVRYPFEGGGGTQMPSSGRRRVVSGELRRRYRCRNGSIPQRMTNSEVPGGRNALATREDVVLFITHGDRRSWPRWWAAYSKHLEQSKCGVKGELIVEYQNSMLMTKTLGMLVGSLCSPKEDNMSCAVL
jgi:hypothetical protein